MSLTARVRRLHRFLGVAIGLQVLLWTASGIYFAWTDLDEIHGDHLRVEPPAVVLDRDWVAPGQIDFASASIDPPRGVRSIDLVAIGGEPHYRLQIEDSTGTPRSVLANARTGTIRGPLDREEAVELARASFVPGVEVLDAVRLTDDDVGRHHEYRGRPLPAWRVRFAHDSRTHVYIAAVGAQVVTHRNRGWRIFDALWMLHTMDYLGRDNFNNPLLRIVSLSALAVTLTGYLMWYRTRPRRRRPTPPA